MSNQRTPQLHQLTAALICFMAITRVPASLATTYDVGDGQPLATISAVPWESLQPGDTVRIHWRPAPFREKWVITAQGTAAQPIRIVGVPGPAGELPVIDGENAVTRLQLDYWNEPRAVIKVGGSSIPADVMPRYIEIASLDVRGARRPTTFTDDAGAAQTYAQNAAAIFIEKGEHITIRNCIIRDSGNGLFVASSDAAVSRDILIDGCYIHDNGNVGSAFEHNTYTAAIGIVYQFNHFGPLLPGALGNNLKDRSAGLVVRYNRIDSGNRQLDLVDAEDSAIIQADPGYRATFVYGNLLIEFDNAGNKQITHYGGDSGNEPTYRKGTLYFYNNTIESRRASSTTLFRLSTNDEHCDARNNIFYTAHAGGGLSILDSTGAIALSHNWHKPGWITASSGLAGTVSDDGTSIVASASPFQNLASGEYRLPAGSPCIDASAPLLPQCLPDHDVLSQFRADRQPGPRPRGVALDIGAFEGFCPGDIDLDRTVGLQDLAGLLRDFGDAACNDATPCLGDLNRDGSVDLGDLALLLAAFGNACQ